MENRLGYLCIETPDIGRARAFYSALFGWRWDEDGSTPTYAHVADRGFAVDGPALGLAKGEKTDFSHLYFRVADIQSACRKVTELGGRAAIPAESASGLSVTVCDDQGVSFGLWQPAPG